MPFESVDFMAIGAHPDDVELGCGGTLLRLSALGRKGVVVDFTDATMGTRGTPELRMKEAAAAAKVLKVQRVNLALPDGNLADTWESQKRLIEQIRRFRPKVLITHHAKEEHPDHEAAAHIVKHACYKAGLAKLDCGGKPFRPRRIFHFVGIEAHTPSFCVDITPYWTKKLQAVLCFKSQFHNSMEKSYRGKTDISTPAFLESVETRNKFWGLMIRRKFAEAFVTTDVPEIDDITLQSGERFP